MNEELRERASTISHYLTTQEKEKRFYVYEISYETCKLAHYPSAVFTTFEKAYRCIQRFNQIYSKYYVITDKNKTILENTTIATTTDTTITREQVQDSIDSYIGSNDLHLSENTFERIVNECLDLANKNGCTDIDTFVDSFMYNFVKFEYIQEEEVN